MNGSYKVWVMALTIMTLAAQKGLDILGFHTGHRESTPHIRSKGHRQRHKIQVSNGKWMMRAHRSRH